MRIGPVSVELAAVRERKRAMVAGARQNYASRLTQDGLDLIEGEAHFTGPNTVEIFSKDGGTQQISAPLIVIDTGTRPKPLAITGAGDVPVLDSTSIMELDALPQHLIIVGGGYIGLEFGQMFRRFGSEVTIVQHGARLLKNEDEDVCDEVAALLRDDGITVLTSSTPVRVEAAGGGDLRLTIRTADGEKQLEGSHLLSAIGRIPNTEALTPGAAGIRLNEHGFIEVDEYLQTSVPGIYAMGDVTGSPAFTHSSYDDYRILHANLVRHRKASTRDRIVPYTPAASSTSHTSATTWYDNANPYFAWTNPNSFADASFRRVHYVLDHFGDTIPTKADTALPITQKQLLVSNLANGIWVFHVITEDQSGNLTKKASHVVVRVGPDPGTGTVFGSVFDENNHPVTGAIVRVNRGLFQGTTNSSGTYSLSGVAAGAWEISVQYPRSHGACAVAQRHRQRPSLGEFHTRPHLERPHVRPLPGDGSVRAPCTLDGHVRSTAGGFMKRLVVCALLVGCGGDDSGGGSPIAIEDLGMRLGEVSCQKVFECCTDAETHEAVHGHHGHGPAHHDRGAMRLVHGRLLQRARPTAVASVDRGGPHGLRRERRRLHRVCEREPVAVPSTQQR